MSNLNEHRREAAVPAVAPIKQAVHLFLAAAILAVALPAVAQSHSVNGGMIVEAGDESRYVTRALRTNSPTLPHRPETDIDFPRR